jgi:flagellar protein FliJ
VVERRLGVVAGVLGFRLGFGFEEVQAQLGVEAALFHPTFMKGWRERRARMDEQIQALVHEEEGARDALARAFEELKKYEQVMEMAKVAEAKEASRRETAALDELGLRAAAGR